jgi:hypothetical protein
VTTGEGNWGRATKEGSPVEAFISNINEKLSGIASFASTQKDNIASLSAGSLPTGRIETNLQRWESIDQSMPGECVVPAWLSRLTPGQLS